MAKYYYTAIFEAGDQTVGVTFPDLPGCVTAGDSFYDALANAEAALAMHLAGMTEDGEEIPQATMPEDVASDPDVREIARVMVGAEHVPGKMRFNIMLDRSLVDAIDAVSPNRSRFLTEAARAKLSDHLEADRRAVP